MVTIASASYPHIGARANLRGAIVHHRFPATGDLVWTSVGQCRAEAVAGIAAIERHCAGTNYSLCALLAKEFPVVAEAIRRTG